MNVTVLTTAMITEATASYINAPTRFVWSNLTRALNRHSGRIQAGRLLIHFTPRELLADDESHL